MLKEIENRRSIRKYQEKPVSDAVLAQLLESARLAPSGSNTQPWRFIVVRSPERKEKIARAVHNQKWMLTAPVFIVCVADIRCRIDAGEPAILDENSPENELKLIIRDTAIAVEHMVLEAESLGLGTCWTAWFEQKDIRPLLNIPQDKYVCCVLTVGYPDEKPGPRPRKEQAELVHYETW
jgi:nitroreductase